VALVAHMRKEIATDLADILSSMDEEAAETVNVTSPRILTSSPHPPCKILL
jgi:hypothetical protein